ncbi:amino acid ABC transporter permease [Massilia sp. G4R7]|uniref:Amino acid ABC transporter permease n=1 Tax=Massilia phyllostachyos TaxID=2898585 RepID=A0ABS8Q4N7_9BURK|nr:amino acid ABC transporter permease [Massilia phyllostachyos]MCD2516717.1 amino acid ABC transporter permease [Massilia phyllostachyos]
MTFDPTILEPYLGDLAAGARLTALACALALAGALVLGIAVALMRTASGSQARRIANLYVDVFRNVPFIVQLFFLFYGLPEIGVELSAFATGVLALSLAGGAFVSDVIRSGILALEPGVLEAAQVSGLSRLAIYRRIVLPIALRTSIRPLGAVFVNLILTSSILSAITLNELTGAAKIVASDTFAPFEVYALLLVVYAFMTWLVSLASGALHRRLNRNLA